MTIEPTRVGDPDVYVLRNLGSGEDGPALSEECDALVTGLHGGFQALNLAVLAGSTRIVLLGYDMKPGPKVGGRLKNNWHDEHVRQTPGGHYDVYRLAFKKAAPAIVRLGVEVLNATPGSALEVFPRVELESVLPDPLAAVVPA